MFKIIISFSIGIALLLFVACNASKIQKKSSRSLAAIPLFSKEGHRGTRGLMPENTIPAFKKAIDIGVTTLETDVVISKDRNVVISHDIYFHQDFTTTPEGDFLDAKEAQQRLLYNMTYDSIRKYDVGIKSHKDFPKQEHLPAYKPLLAEMIDSVENYCRRKGVSVDYNIELKTNATYDGTKQPPVEETVDMIMQVLKSKKIYGRYYLQSFDFRPLKILHQKYPEVVTAVLIAGSEKRTLTQQLTDLGYVPEIYSPSFNLVTKELIDECHKRNMKIIPWTVNTTDDIKRLKNWGVDGIITDYPDYFSPLPQF